MILGLHQTQEHRSPLLVNLSTGPKSLMTLETLVLPKKTPHQLTHVLHQHFNNLNITEDEFCDRTKSLLGHESDWEVHVAQQIPLPRSRSPYPDDSHEALEQLEPETDNDLDDIDYRSRPANDKRLPKPTRR